MWVFPILLIIPNILLSITAPVSWSAVIANIALPAGLYYILISLSTRTGRSVLLFFPIIFFAAFQIVLLSLYGQSIIGVDMLLNVVTTNSGEVAELLDNLIVPMLVIAVLYVGPMVWAVIAIIKKKRAPYSTLRRCRLAGCTIAACGIVATCISYATVPCYSMRADIFPINVAHNVVIAVDRTIKTKNYHESSKDFRYGAVSTNDPSRKEVYVMVIGETSRAQNWQLFGYDRDTNPCLCATDSLIGFSRALTESNTTHKSVPMMMSTLTAEDYDSIYSRKCIISAFKEAGFHTAFLSMQRYNHSFIDFFGMEADTADFIRERNPQNVPLYDGELLKATRRFIEASSEEHPKLFVVLHTYGSHFNYRERYPKDDAYFTPDNAPEASPRFRQRLINAYDNTIRYTDRLLGDLISYLGSLPETDCALIYASDHGEDIFDYGSGRFLHASPIPTYNQLHVPMILWMSKSYRNRYPQKWINAYAHRDLNVSTSESITNTMLDIAGIETRYSDMTKAVSHASYSEPGRRYINDHNEAIGLRHTGMNRIDLELLEVNKLINNSNHTLSQSFPK